MHEWGAVPPLSRASRASTFYYIPKWRACSQAITVAEIAIIVNVQIRANGYFERSWKPRIFDWAENYATVMTWIIKWRLSVGQWSFTFPGAKLLSRHPKSVQDANFMVLKESKGKINVKIKLIQLCVRSCVLYILGCKCLYFVVVLLDILFNLSCIL